MERPPTTQTSHGLNSNRQDVLSHRTSERIAALLLILYSIAQIITIVARIASSTDQPDALSSIAMISANHSWYIASKIANLIAAFLLLAASVFIFQVFRPFDRTLALLTAVLLATAGIFWLHSSLAGMALAETYGAPLPETAVLSENVRQSAFFAIEPVRAIAGRVGFTAAALGSGLMERPDSLRRAFAPLAWLGRLGNRHRHALHLGPGSSGHAPAGRRGPADLAAGGSGAPRLERHSQFRSLRENPLTGDFNV